MSYDVWLTIDTGDDEPMRVGGYDLNHTYNCSGMFRLALGGDGINDLHLKVAGDELLRLRRAVEHIKAPSHHASYQAMNPANEWGSHETATRFLERILGAAERNPKATINVG